MLRIILKIEGMMCGMCEAHICDTIRKQVPSAKKVTASRSRKEASFLTKVPVDENSLKAAVDSTGYKCTDILAETFEKRGLFG